jgi:hypothetical protein
MSKKGKGLVDSELVGEVWPAAQPGESSQYGHVTLEPTGAFEVRSTQTFRLVYTVGRFGLDDTGSIRVAFRGLGDQGALQTSNPSGYNYVTASSSTSVPLEVRYDAAGVAHRPRTKALTVRVTGGFLRENDTITIVFGDTSQGSPGMRMQTFAESRFEFKVSVDVCATGQYIPLPDTPHIAIVPGEPVVWRAVLPTLRRPGEPFRFGLKAEDIWGNPSDRAAANLRFETTLPVKGLPKKFDYPLGEKSVCFEDLTVRECGTLRIAVKDEQDQVLAESHPLVIREGSFGGYWGDLHGQSGETVGVGTAREYFDFARNKAFLDVTSHQANDFQISDRFWQQLNELTAEFLEEGKFVTFPGYEWSGNTAVGGDRNVFFRNEGQPMHRSSHALLTDRSDLDTDAQDARVLFEKLANRDCLVYAHVGGRYADIALAHDPKLETAVEIHSAWGTFEWMLTDGFELGHRSGVVCNSDGHKGRPGASHPGASTFGAYGGLTCFYSEVLTRDGIFDCLKRRHHYGTSGTRMHLNVRVEFDKGATLFEADPNVFPDTHIQSVTEVMMGDIVQTDESNVTLRIEVAAQSPIERIEVRNGKEVIETLRPYRSAELGERVRVVWSGAEYRGRSRESNWEGKARFGGATIKNLEKINAWNHERVLECESPDTVVWQAITTGNFSGLDVWLDVQQAGELEVTTNLGSLQVPLDEVGLQDTVIDAGGLERRLRVFRLPDRNPHREMMERVEVALRPTGDNPLWVCVTTEDGFQAWSSPIYIFR